jgi:hypothetical protein
MRHWALFLVLEEPAQRKEMQAGATGLTIHIKSSSFRTHGSKSTRTRNSSHKREGRYEYVPLARLEVLARCVGNMENKLIK